MKYDPPLELGPAPSETGRKGAKAVKPNSLKVGGGEVSGSVSFFFFVLGFSIFFGFWELVLGFSWVLGGFSKDGRRIDL